MISIKNFFKNRIYKPTPLFWRCAGDSVLFGLGFSGAADAFMRGQKEAAGIMIAAMIGKFVSNIPTEKK